MHKLGQSALTYIRNFTLLRAGDRVGVAVSGGADSVGLLRLMLELRQEIGLVLSVVHLNHKLRGVESDADEAFVRELAEGHGLELILESCDVKEYAAKKKAGVEAAARELRYELFERLVGSRTWSKIATAHTLDDQAETLLLKLARGAGTRGLAGIWPRVAISPPSATIKSGIHRADDQAIVRPLLATHREDLRIYLAEIGQSWREDSSNRDLRHMRNRIRHGILPRFERHVNPRVCDTLAETAEIARGEEEYWAQEVGRLLSQVWCDGALNCTKLGTFPLALRRRLVRAAGEFLGLMLEFRHVEEILSLEGEGSAALPCGWRTIRQGDLIRFEKLTQKPSNYEYVLSVPGRVAVLEARLNVEAVVVNDGVESQDLLDSSVAPREFVVRNWRAGERFWPAHTKEPKKIKELLQDRHVTGDEKKRWPVIASGDEVVWVSGFGIRRDFRAKDNVGILIREIPIEPE